MSAENKQHDASSGSGPNDFYRYLCNGSSHAIVAADCQGIIINWNMAAEGLFGFSAVEMLGTHIEQIVPESRRGHLRDAIDRAISKRQISEFEITYDRGEGKEQEDQTLLITINAVEDEGGEVQGLSAWGLDITRRKKLQEQLVQAEKLASLGTLASGVAHHFNNIIGGVATFVDYALTTESAQASRRALQMTAESANRISQITSSLLTFAEKDIRQFDLSDLTEVIMTFGHLVEKPLAEKKITLEMHLQATGVYEVPGSRIHQLLGNLLDNAEHAMPHGGVISISLYRQGDILVMDVSDIGCGIAPDILPHIFDPFFTTRGIVAGGDHAASSGLGLSVVHGIVKELGGTINVTSQVGKGTTFNIALPIVQKKSK